MLEVELGKSVESELGLFLEFFGPCQPAFFQALLFWALVLYCVIHNLFLGFIVFRLPGVFQNIFFRFCPLFQTFFLALHYALPPF
jgi:hypothetical protein